MIMRNIDKIRQMSLEELAPLLVHSTEEDIGDYDWNENPIPYYVTFWYSPSGNYFQDYVGHGQQEAIEDCIEWLDSAYVKEVYNDTNWLCSTNDSIILLQTSDCKNW